MSVICPKCNAEDFYFEENNGPHKTAVCASCGSYIKHLSKNQDFVFYFGKYKSRNLSSMISKEEKSYLNWLLTTDIKTGLKEKITKHLELV